ncbi:MAG: outer membrane lipoprotein [Sulfuricaulis sp.]
MNTQVNKPPRLLTLAAGVAAILLSAASIMGCNMNNPDNNAAPTKSPAYSSGKKCTDCGRIESVQEVVTRGEGSGLGAVGGAVVGGAVGHQVGSGRGQDLATVAGAVGGAVAGNEIEKRVKSTKSYAITVRLDDGSSRVFYEASPPTWRPGDQVKVTNGAIQSNR